MKSIMKERILHAYEHPEEKAVFYSANLEKTGSDRLDNIEHWDWSCDLSRSVAGNTTCIAPLALNCPRVRTSEGELWVDPIFDEDEEDFELDIPSVRSGYAEELFLEMEKMVKDLSEGEVIREVDVQSPLGIAELMCGQNLYIALYESPDEIKAMLDKITDYNIGFIKEMRKICGKKLNGAAFPFIWSDEKSTLISDDTLTLLSPEQHLEFSLPYVNKFADAVGPIHYHSCSWYERFYDNIKQVRNVRTYNWNVGNSDDPHKIMKEFSGRAVLAPHIGLDMHKSDDAAKWSKELKDEVELLSYILDGMQDNTSLHLWLGFDKNPEILEQMYDILNERGYTPQNILR